MDKAVEALLSRLTYGQKYDVPIGHGTYGVVGTLARVYEKARNALEYRADHLVRRAAIERILRRRMLLNKDPESLASELLRELRWARYLSIAEINSVSEKKLTEVLKKYTQRANGVVSEEWIVKIASAEIEEIFNLNVDFRQFTFLAFRVIREKVKIKDEDLDLLVYFAVDKVYAESDDEQVAYHILELAGDEFSREKLEEAWRLFNLARNHKLLPKISKFVRRQMPPLIVLRDIYFYKPDEFKKILSDEGILRERAREVLDIQLGQMSDRISTAGVRSIIYVFLSKMVLAIGIEIPLEVLIYGTLAKIPLVVNLLFPPFLMWVATREIRIPKEEARQALVERTVYIVNNFDSLREEPDALVENVARKTGLGYWIFSGLYIVIFIAIFGLIFFVLSQLRFTITSQFIFVFFLTIVVFFAFRISQIAKVYSWKPPGESQQSFLDTISLPILAVGSKINTGITHLNFLAFAFDFILEAPFKLILGFLDSWVQFLSIKKEEEIAD